MTKTEPFAIYWTQVQDVPSFGVCLSTSAWSCLLSKDEGRTTTEPKKFNKLFLKNWWLLSYPEHEQKGIQIKQNKTANRDKNIQDIYKFTGGEDRRLFRLGYAMGGLGFISRTLGQRNHTICGLQVQWNFRLVCQALTESYREWSTKMWKQKVNGMKKQLLRRCRADSRPFRGHGAV